MARLGDIRLRLIGLALFSALPLLALGIYRLTTSAIHDRTMLRSEAIRAAQVAAARVDEKLHAADALLLGLSNTLRADLAERSANEVVLRRTLSIAPSPSSNLFLLDTIGTLVATAKPVDAKGDTIRAFANRAFFNVVRRRRDLVVGELRQSEVLEDHPWVVILARAITDTAGHFRGVVSMPVRMDSLLQVAMTPTELGPPLVTIIDSSGVILARSAEAEKVVGRQTPPHTVPMDSSGTQAVRGIDGDTRLTGFTRTHSAPWMIYVGVSQAALDNRLSASLRQDIALFLLAVMIAVAAAYMVGQRITQPIQSLVNAARAFERGDTGTRAVASGPSEVRLLSNAFNQMADTVDRRSAALADSERRYRLLFDSNPLPMWAWDADTMQVMAANEAALEKYGYDRDQFLSLRITDLLDPSELPRFSGARLPFSENRQSAGTWLHRTANGRQVEMEVITTSSRRLGRASWLSVGIDVTARREAERALARSEEQLHQSQKLEAVGTFAGGISHDFNNLLTGMLGYCDLALSELDENSEAFRDVSEVRALAMRGSDLARQILTVSRKQVVQPTQLDPNDVMRGIDRLLRRVVGAHIDFSVDLAEHIGTMHADAGQLEQVVLNLASNARDAMPNGGVLRIETSVVPADRAPAKQLPAGRAWIKIVVRDTGVGMSAEVRERIFEPFFTTKERGKGTGLGLALAHAMVEQAGGVVRVESEPGVGTTFSLFFPRLDPATPARESTERAVDDLAGTETILFAEDEVSVRAVATAALERYGYRVLSAADGDAAVAISRAFPGKIDLLLTDVVMPGMSGRELAEVMRQARPGINVMFVSGYTDDEALLGDVRNDERAFLQKPFTTLELVRRIRAALDQHARIG